MIRVFVCEEHVMRSAESVVVVCLGDRLVDALDVFGSMEIHTNSLSKSVGMLCALVKQGMRMCPKSQVISETKEKAISSGGQACICILGTDGPLFLLYSEHTRSTSDAHRRPNQFKNWQLMDRQMRLSRGQMDAGNCGDGKGRFRISAGCIQ